MESKMTSEEKKRVWNALDKLEEGQTRILFLLENDDKTNRKGLVQKVDEVVSWQKSMKGKIAMWTSFFMAIGFGIVFIIKELFKKKIG